VPDRTDLDRLDAALTAVLGPGRHVALAADLGPAERYRRWLRVRRGGVAAVAGTRAAAFAPVAALGLVAIWDDGDDLHAEPRAPYPHARDRAAAARPPGGHRRAAGRARPHGRGAAAARHRLGPADRRRSGGGPGRGAAGVAAGDDAELARDAAARTARLPTLAWRTAAEALAAGAPVLVQVPRRGYLPALACARCRAPARCAHCSGPLASTSGHAVPACRWCGRPAAYWSCPACGSTGCARSSSAPAVRPRSSAGRSPACRCGPPAARACSPR
jgi:primosomal protein N' (replication factor Y)